jgi:hypothetical protein
MKLKRLLKKLKILILMIGRRIIDEMKENLMQFLFPEQRIELK